jgi:hypothetical protein
MLKKGAIIIFCFATCLYGDAQPAHSDSTTMPASRKYADPSFFKRLFLGKNYRTAWSTPVTLPVFRLRDMGFTVKELGGGQQTKSLRLLDKQGREWALRTVDKDVEKAMPPRLRGTLAQTVTQDMVSAAYPYAPLTIPMLAQAANIVTATPVFYAVLDDPGLGEYQSIFKNAMVMLEAREPTPDGSDTKNTENTVKAILKDHEVQVNAEAVLRARLLDMLIADWDRHQDQWRWGFEKVRDSRYAYAIPRDRDQAYFYSNGLVVKVARALAMKHLVGFQKTTRKLRKLNAKSWNFDRTFLSRLNAADWNRVVQDFTTAVNDSVIHAAMKKMPPEVYTQGAPLLEKKLISRRNTLASNAMRYYRFISSNVTIAGTDAPERFVIRSMRDSITVQQFAGSRFSELVYSRTFHRRETQEITVLGLGGADEFIHHVSHKRPRIRLVLDGGSGADVYQLGSKRLRIKLSNSEMDAKAYLDVLKTALRIKD